MSEFKKSKALCLALIIAVIATIIAPIGSFTAFADAEADFIYTVADGEATLVGYTGKAEELTLPSTLGGYPLTTIGGGAFEENNTLVTLTIPNGVTTIDTYAFLVCYELTTIHLPNSLTTINDNAFYSCDSLTSITLPDSVTHLGAAFYSCDALTDITLPKEISVLREKTFNRCSALKTLTLPDSITTIETNAIYDCGSFKSLVIPKSVTSISPQSVSSCYYFAEFVVSDENPSYCAMDGVLFSKDIKVLVQYPSFKEDYVVPNNVVTIGDWAFGYCKRMLHVTVGNQVTSIGDYAFAYTNVHQITIPENVTSLGENVFVNVNTMFFTIIAKPSSAAYQYALDNGYNVDILYDKIKSVSHKIVDDQIVFTVVTGGGNYNRVKAMVNDKLVAYTSTYETSANGDRIWTITADAPTENTRYAFDLRLGFTNEYSKELFYHDVKLDYGIESVSHEISGDKILFTVVTDANSYNRVKVTLSDDLKGYLAYSSSYTVNDDGNYVWTIKAPAPTETTNYAFDIRSDETGKYIRKYFEYNVEVVSVFKSISHEISGNKIIFTVTTSADNYNRAKVTFANDLKGYIAYSNTYTVNADGDYVWIIKANAPAQTTSYAFDLRSGETGKYIREYYTYDVEVDSSFKSVSHEISGNKIIFTVVTNADNYNRVKVTLKDDLKGYIAYSSSYTVNSDGDYVWIIKATAPTEATNYAFDIRSDETGKYIREYYYYNV